MNADALLRVRNLKTHFPVKRGVLKAVDGVSFDIARGRTLGLVGETGCGKTTLGRTILRLIPHTAGEVLFEGVDVLRMDRKRLRATRRDMQVVFQDPAGSLNPRMTVGDIVGEPMLVHRVAARRELTDRVARLLERVGLSADSITRYPHEFSGGQRQRIGIARAIALQPKFIVCDEPVSSLDVSIQSQILNLLADLREELGLSYLFIAHDLAVVKHFSDDVAIMYLGKIVERGPVDAIYRNPRHPYTQALLRSVPQPDPSRRGKLFVLGGEVPSPADPPPGCAFHPRCPFVTPECRQHVPLLEQKPGSDPGHIIACHHADQSIEPADPIITGQLPPR